MRKHIVITGTGRTGTTFLVQLLGELGLDIGAGLEKICFNPASKCGFEYDIRNINAPYVVKDPRFCDYAEEVFTRSDIRIEHIIVPMRNLYEAAQSRRHVHKMFGDIRGGLWETGVQENTLLKKVYTLMLNASKTNVPVMLINYPMLTQDNAYLYEKLQMIMKVPSFGKFNKVFKRIIRLDWVHNYSKELTND